MPATRVAESKVALVRCRSYGKEVRAAFKTAFDLIGGLGSLVKNKTVTVKLNLTGTDFAPFLGRSAGETYTTHFATAEALAAELFAAGARRVRFVESTQSRTTLETTLLRGQWDLSALGSLGKVEFENTRNLGLGRKYAELKVPDGGRLFSHFHFNHAYDETDVMVSLCKLKQHLTAGVTLSMKNLFGITPNSLYGEQLGSEEATEGRTLIHAPGTPEDPHRFDALQLKMPGFKPRPPAIPSDPGVRIPRAIADICAARPIHLAIIDGITSVSGAEGWWCQGAVPMRLTEPGVIIVGLNPVSADAVGTAVMGAPNPRASRGEAPFALCENHLLLAEQAGLGVADLAKIDVRGLSLKEAIHPYSMKGLEELVPGRKEKSGTQEAE